MNTASTIRIELKHTYDSLLRNCISVFQTDRGGCHSMHGDSNHLDEHTGCDDQDLYLKGNRRKND